MRPAERERPTRPAPSRRPSQPGSAGLARQQHSDGSGALGLRMVSKGESEPEGGQACRSLDRGRRGELDFSGDAGRQDDLALSATVALLVWAPGPLSYARTCSRMATSLAQQSETERGQMGLPGVALGHRPPVRLGTACLPQSTRVRARSPCTDNLLTCCNLCPRFAHISGTQ